MAGTEESLEQLRAELEGIDRSILLLLGQRIQTARRAVGVRRRRGADDTDRAQEAVVLQRAADLARAFGVPSDLVLLLWQGLIAEAKRPGPLDPSVGVVTVFVEAPCRPPVARARLSGLSRPAVSPVATASAH